MTCTAILSDIKTFLKANEMSPSAFGKAAMGDGNFVREIEFEGRSMTLRTEEKLRAFMTSYEAKNARKQSSRPASGTKQRRAKV